MIRHDLNSIVNRIYGRERYSNGFFNKAMGALNIAGAVLEAAGAKSSSDKGEKMDGDGFIQMTYIKNNKFSDKYIFDFDNTTTKQEVSKAKRENKSKMESQGATDIRFHVVKDGSGAEFSNFKKDFNSSSGDFSLGTDDNGAATIKKYKNNLTKYHELIFLRKR